MPSLLSRCDVYEVPISCGYMLTMLALGGDLVRVTRAEAGVAVAGGGESGLRAGGGGATKLVVRRGHPLVPVAQAWPRWRRVWRLLVAATGPIMLIGFGLMLYNVRRFDDPFEFGNHYQLTGHSQIHEQLFSLRYFWLHLRAYFFETTQWSGRFPFVHRAGSAFGVLTNVPLAWLALAAPLAWRGRVGPAGSVLRGFVTAVALLFGMCALTLALCCWVTLRYEVDFLPSLVLLAVIGILSFERALAPTSESGQACRPLWRRVARWGYGFLLVFSVAFSLFASVGGCAEADNDLGTQLQASGQVPEAIRLYEQALRLDPDLADAHINLGIALMQTGRIQEAIGQYEQALRIKPDSSKGHNEFGIALARLGRLPEATSHWEQALRIKPTYFEAHNNLGNALAQTGKIKEAIAHYEQALRIKPNLAEAHYNLGTALAQTGKIKEAVAHFEQALRINPDYAEAHFNLGIALAQAGKIEEAIAHFGQALRIKPDYAEAHYNYGVALEQVGRVPEAIAQYTQALRIKPDFPEAQNALARLQARQK